MAMLFFAMLLNWFSVGNEQLLEALSYNDCIPCLQNMKKKCFIDIILAICPQRKQDCFMKFILILILTFFQRDYVNWADVRRVFEFLVFFELNF